MGSSRFVVECAVRDILEFLQRNRCAPDLIFQVRRRFTLLLSALCEPQEAAGPSGELPSSALCESILDDIVDDVVMRVAPGRRAAALDSMLREAFSKIAALQQEVDRLTSRLTAVTAEKKRHDAANEYTMSCYFKEVLLLRAKLQELITGTKTKGLFPRDASNRRVAKAVGVVTTVSALRDVSGAAPAERPPLPALEGSATSVVPNESTSKEAQSPDSAKQETSQLQRTLSDIATSAAAFHSPSTDALFDYFKYVQLREDASFDLEDRLRKLAAEFDGYKEYIANERQKEQAHFKAQLEDGNQEISRLRSRIEELEQTLVNASSHFRSVTGSLREMLAALKRELRRLLSATRSESNEAASVIEEVELNNALTLELVQAGARYITAMGTPSGDDEEYSREILQQLMEANDDDSIELRNAKAYLRRHRAAKALVESVVQTRKNFAELKERVHLANLALQAAGSSSHVKHPPAGASRPLETLPATQLLQVARDNKAMRHIFRSGKNELFEMDEKERQTLKAVAGRAKDLLQKKLKMTFHRISRRLLNNKIVKSYQKVMDERGLDSAFGVASLKERFDDYVVQSKEEQRLYQTEIIEAAVALLGSLGKATVEKLLGIRRPVPPKPPPVLETLELRRRRVSNVQKQQEMGDEGASAILINSDIRVAGNEEAEELMRIQAVHLQQRYFPMMGGIGQEPVQKRSLALLASMKRPAGSAAVFRQSYRTCIQSAPSSASHHRPGGLI